MPYDPAIPATNAEATSAMFRGQFQGLHDLITAIVQIVAAQVDGVTTLLPGESAAAGAALIGDTLHFTFSIPRGDVGVQGQPGIDGGIGPQGPPFAQAIIDAVNTLNPGDGATVTVSYDGTNVHFTFGIPRGTEGVQGPPGEVTNATLASAISGTSNNTNTVPTLDTPFANDPPTLADLETLRAAYNALVQAARR